MKPTSLIKQAKIKNIPSLLKWTGSKRSQAYKIAEYVPPHNRYYEPFLGSGALLYLFARPQSVGADIYKPLVEFWKLVKDDPHHLIENYQYQWEQLQKNLPSYYYDVRDRFNISQRPEDLNFLMRTCVNGIVRFSKTGKFNNSFHLSRKGMNPKLFEKNVLSWSERIQLVDFRHGSFEETILDAKKGDFIYLDPPYSGSKQRYIEDLNLEALIQTLNTLNKKEIKWALSFDGNRGLKSYAQDIPPEIYKRKILIYSGQSAVSKVLNGPVEPVTESLYLNY